MTTLEQETIRALKVIVFTRHIREYLELYDPQALKQAVEALTINDPSFHTGLAKVSEHDNDIPEAAFGAYNRRTDELLGRASVFASSVVVEEKSSLTTGKNRLEYLRGELRAERISYGELAELQSLAPFIDASDVELREAAGIPENKLELKTKIFRQA